MIKMVKAVACYEVWGFRVGEVEDFGLLEREAAVPGILKERLWRIRSWWTWNSWRWSWQIPSTFREPRSIVTYQKTRILVSRGAHIPGIKPPVRLNFVRRPLIFWGFPVWNLLRVSLLAPRILRWLLEVSKVCGFLLQSLLVYGYFT